MASVGCVESSFRGLDTLINMDYVEICAVLTKKDFKANSSLVDLSNLFLDLGIQYYFKHTQEREGTHRFLKGFESEVGELSSPKSTYD